MRALLLIAIAVWASGCVTMQTQLLGPRLSYEARVYLLDAEEDLMTARARAEQAERDLVRAKHAYLEADERFQDLRESVLKKEAKAEVAVAKAQVIRAERSLDLLEASAGCAERRYVAARSRAAVKFKAEGADEGEANSLSDRAAGCETKLEKREQALSDAEEAVAKAKAEQDRASIAAAAAQPLDHPRPWVE